MTCEHASNRVPAELRPLAAASADLESYRAFDPGALPLARALASRLGASMYAAEVSRIVVDANRSAHNPRVFGAVARRLDAEGRRRALERWYAPYRREIEATILAVARRRTALHLAVHTFPPGRRGWRPDADFAILYDPRRPRERAFAARLRAAVRRSCPELRVRRNHPYRGRSDGVATAMRRRLGGTRYLGIELELTQRIAARPAAEWRDLRRRLVDAIAAAVDDQLRVAPRSAIARRTRRTRRRGKAAAQSSRR